MAKTSKKSKAATSSESALAVKNSAVASASSMETPTAGKASAAKSTPATERPNSARSRSGSALGKASAARKPRVASAAGKTRKSRAGAVSDEDIRLRAYFIAERRMLSGIPGDSAHDWLEARRQLQEEAGKSA